MPMNKPVKPKVMAKPKPKTAITKSRGSNTAKQVGDQNLRETTNAMRDSMKNKKVGSFPMKGGKIQNFRAGGKGK
jgi:hypothetical protein